MLEPVVRGCIWDGEAPGLELLQLYAVCLVEPLAKADNSPSPKEMSLKSQKEEQRKCQMVYLHVEFENGEQSFL